MTTRRHRTPRQKHLACGETLVICDNLGHRMRTIFTYEIKSVHLLSTRCLVQLNTAVPQSFQKEYLLNKIITIPIFSRFDYHHEIKRLDGLTLLRYADRNETVLLTDCETKFEMRICSANQRKLRNQKSECQNSHQLSQLTTSRCMQIVGKVIPTSVTEIITRYVYLDCLSKQFVDFYKFAHGSRTRKQEP